MNSNRTFTMLKPDSIEQGNMLPILNMIENAGFKIIALKYKKMSKDEAEKFYSIHSDKPFFNDLVSFMTRGPIIAAALEKENAVEEFRELIGSTDPQEAMDGTIRKKFAKSKGENAVHGSDSDENASIEIDFHFDSNEIFS
ncbi:MAG: nucleoside-diphosphate kinase [Candidatus Marisimplicoccus sp.]|jgi:nucleoside-diphosphate kinase|nr:nucleoside-diphosphate kinase [Flavobacteriaceae bacterium]MDB0024822.1 nucleoside-diphosphate kinase [bacterium]RZP00563.1 MAG: nucleoside-diphosphate kinase [Flavobacteriales bacterium]|tara:strand:+ start:2531 stop:2953 length:423 start_codon:yes stop_codon:yes gene_type:complete